MTEVPPLRPATVADAEPLAALIRVAFTAQERPTDPPSGALQETTESVKRHLAELGGGILAEGPVAALLWQEKAGGLYVGRLAVHPEWRGRGLARRLIAAAEELARERGLKRIHLSTRLMLHGNRRLFASLGFVEGERHAHPGYTEPTSIDMEKWLG
jgi:GNAT superfamily N-acetyltransferase